MNIDVTTFHLYNVSDTCSIWNILSSKLLYKKSQEAKVDFICTAFVIYECLHKARPVSTEEAKELQFRLKKAMDNGAFKTCILEVEDLQDVTILEQRQRLGKGELSSIVLANKIAQGFITDDKKARGLATKILSREKVQTTPHLLGWLVFTSYLSDGDIDEVITEHTAMERRPLTDFFREAYKEACRCRLMVQQQGK